MLAFHHSVAEALISMKPEVWLCVDMSCSIEAPQPLLMVQPAACRELAQQVAAACRPLKALFGLRTVVCFGGAGREVQAGLLRESRVHIVVATPGRLLDLLDAGDISLGMLSHCKVCAIRADGLSVLPRLANAVPADLPHACHRSCCLSRQSNGAGQ